MSLRKDETSYPAPLPMPQHVLLKHVPTMVRRRYDSHLDKLIQDLPSNDGKSEGDEDEDVDPNSTTNDVGDSFNDDTKDGVLSNEATIGECDNYHNTRTCTKDFGPSAKKCKSEGDEPKYVNISSYYTDDSDEDENKDNMYGNFEDKQGLLLDDNESNKEEYSYGDAIVNMDVQDEELEMQQENFPTMTTMTLGKNANKKGYHSPRPLPMYQRVTLKHVPTMVRRKYDRDLHKFDASKDLPSKDNEIEGDEDEDEDVDPASPVTDVGDNVNDEAKDGVLLEHATIGKCDINQDTQTCTEDFGPNASSDMEEDKWDIINVLKDANTVSYSVDDHVENDMEVGNFDNKLGLRVDECKSEGDGPKDVNVCGYYTNDSDEDENKDEKFGNFDDKEGLLLDDNESHKEDDSYGYAIINMDVQDEGLEMEPENSLTVMMTFGKNANKKGYHSPRPLPMYQRVTLKHVPTMVRRRYDKDLHKFDASKDFPCKDSEIEDDGEEDVNRGSATSDVGDSINDEAKDGTLSKDTATGKCDINQCMFLEDGKSEDDGLKDVNLANSLEGSDEENNNWDTNGIKDAISVNYSVDDRVENDMEVGNCDNKQDKCESEVVETKDENVAGNYTHDSDEDENEDKECGNIDDKQGLNDIESHKEEDSYRDAIVNTVVQDEGLETAPENSVTIMMTPGKNASKMGYQSPRPLPMYERVTLKQVPTMVRRRYDKDSLKFDTSKGWNSDNGSEIKGDKAIHISEVDDISSLEAEDVTLTRDAYPEFDTKHDAQTSTDEFLDMHSEEDKSEGDEDKKLHLSSSMDDYEKDILQVNGHEKFDSDSSSKDFTTEEDEAKDVNFKYSVNGRIEDEVQDREINLESYYVGDSVKDEVQVKTHGSSDNDHGSHIEHCKSEGDGIDAATYYMDDCIKYEAQETECLNVNNKNGFPIQDLKSEGNSTRDEYHAITNYGMEDHDTGLEDSYCGHDMVDSVHCEDSVIDPEAFKKILARDGYDLCCPNCKRCITKTVILRRKGKGQQCETTCFSCLIAIFRCIQW